MTDTGSDVKPSITIAGQVPFNSFAILCEKISTTQGKERKKDVLKRFIDRWRQAHEKQYGKEKTEDSFFIGMRFLLPHLDRDRLSYGMKEVVLAKYYIEVLNIAKESEDGKRLLNYRAPSSAKKDAGDFAAVAFSVLKNRCASKGSLSMDDVNSSLDTMAQSNAEGRRDLVKKEIQKVIRSSTALEQKWIIRIMLKDMKLGLNENSTLPLFHEDALELYNVCNSLQKVCLDLHDVNTKLNEAEITLFSPFRPMLGQRTSVEDVEKLMHDKMFIIETKIDGERMQLHKDDDEFRYFSRNANDYTDTFGATKYRGTLTPHIFDCFKRDVKKCILDGEMVGFDTSIDSFVLKGANIDIKSDRLAPNIHPCFVVFDILLLNDEKFSNRPLKDRIVLSEKAFDIKSGRLLHVERKTGRNNVDVTSAINDAIDRREEGVVIKDPDSKYKPSKRKGSGWLKLKPEYIDSLSDDLDLIILGGEYGSGHRGGVISHFLLGVAVANEGGRPNSFMTIGKVGSGYTDQELKELLQKLRGHWKKFDPRSPPSSILFTTGFKEKPDVWIEPMNSVIVQIKAAEISVSDKYRCGYTLRFPRLEKFRDDKSWYECMTFDELEELRKIADGKLTHQKFDDNTTSEGPSKKKRRVLTRTERPRAVADHFKGADISTIDEVSEIFSEKEFCVINGSTEMSKQDIERKIAENGGSFVQNPSSETMCVLAFKSNFRVKNIISRGNVDVVHISWLNECLQRNCLLPYQPSHMIFATAQTNLQFRQDFDCYGDSYTKLITNDELRDLFAKIPENEHVISADEIAEIEQRYFNDEASVMSLFRRIRLFVAMFENPTSSDGVHPHSANYATHSANYATHLFTYHSGSLVDDVKNCTHILLDRPGSDAEMESLRNKIHSMRKFPHIVTHQWILDSINSKKLLNERAYGIG